MKFKHAIASQAIFLMAGSLVNVFMRWFTSMTDEF